MVRKLFCSTTGIVHAFSNPRCEKRYVSTNQLSTTRIRFRSLLCKHRLVVIHIRNQKETGMIHPTLLEQVNRERLQDIHRDQARRCLAHTARQTHPAYLATLWQHLRQAIRIVASVRVSIHYSGSRCQNAVSQ